jgi:hypothetical protein
MFGVQFAGLSETTIGCCVCTAEAGGASTHPIVRSKRERMTHDDERRRVGREATGRSFRDAIGRKSGGSPGRDQVIVART